VSECKKFGTSYRLPRYVLVYNDSKDRGMGGSYNGKTNN
jgi:hypothetical protein